jgi:hypothetical protein
MNAGMHEHVYAFNISAPNPNAIKYRDDFLKYFAGICQTYSRLKFHLLVRNPDADIDGVLSSHNKLRPSKRSSCRFQSAVHDF